MSKKGSVKKVVLAYSGGLDTSIILKWLIEEYGCEVIAFSADLGQGQELDIIPEKAKKTGASKCYIEDLREEFVRDFVCQPGSSPSTSSGMPLRSNSSIRNNFV